MNFASCNRVVLQKQREKITSYHKLKLKQIKHRDSKSTNRKQLKRNMNSLEQNKSMENKNKQSQQVITLLNQQVQIPYVPTKKLKSLNRLFKQPNIYQKSTYSFNKMDKQWKKHCEYLSIATKRRSFPLKQGNIYQYVKSDNSHNRDSFQNYFKRFQQYRLSDPKQQVFLFPQNLDQRVVLFKKSILILQTPYLIQISTAYRRVFIIAYSMDTNQSKPLRLIMTKSKAIQIFSQYDYDFNVFTSRIGIQSQKLYVKQIQKQSPDQIKQICLIEKQNQFIQRNYYKFIKNFKHSYLPQISNCIQLKQTIDKFPLQNNQLYQNKSKPKSRSHRTTRSKLFDSSICKKQYQMVNTNTMKKFSKHKKLNSSIQTNTFQSLEHKLNKIFSVPIAKNKSQKLDNYISQISQKQNTNSIVDNQTQLKVQKQQDSNIQGKQIFQQNNNVSI